MNNLKTDALRRWCAAHGACKDGLSWVATQPDLRTAIKECPTLDWLIWYAYSHEEHSPERAAIRRVKKWEINRKQMLRDASSKRMATLYTLKPVDARPGQWRRLEEQQERFWDRFMRRRTTWLKQLLLEAVTGG